MRTDYTGRRFGRLFVVGKAVQPCMWHCRCDCGGEKAARASDMTSGRVTSCGCLATESRSRNGRANRKHGLTHTPIWRMWQSMLRRCNNPTDKDYANYGGRGITVCARWRESIAVFVADMGPRPAGAMIERRNNDLGYEPGNCVWADIITQANNRRNNQRLTHDGRTQTATQWAREIGIAPGTLLRRLAAGWDARRAITEPLHGPSGRAAS